MNVPWLEANNHNIHDVYAKQLIASLTFGGLDDIVALVLESKL